MAAPSALKYQVINFYNGFTYMRGTMQGSEFTSNTTILSQFHWPSSMPLLPWACLCFDSDVSIHSPPLLLHLGLTHRHVLGRGGATHGWRKRLRLVCVGHERL